jgi:hypothetical protein
MFLAKIDGLENLGSICDRLSQFTELDHALKKGADIIRDAAIQNLPEVEPPAITAGAAPLTWKITTNSMAGWRKEWGRLHNAPQPWFAPAANNSRDAVIAAVTKHLGSLR